MKKLLLGTVFLVTIGYASYTNASCTWLILPTGTWTTSDLVRSVVGIVNGILGLTGDGEAKAQLIAQQEENNEKAGSGNGGSSGGSSSGDSSEDSSSDASSSDESSSSNNEDTSVGGASEFSGSAYSYVKTNLLDKQGNVGYEPLKTALTSASDSSSVRQNLRTAIRENFFADITQEDQKTTEYQQKIKAKRHEYILDATYRHITIANTVKNNIQTDLSSAGSASVAGSNELASIAIDSHTLEEAIKMELVDLALQIEMMEADAIQFLTHQPVELLPETKPSTKNS